MAAPSDGGRQRDRGEQGVSGLAESYRKAEPFLAASMSLVISVAVFLGLGIWLDRKIGWKVPWLTMLGAVLGMVGGFVSFFKTVLGTRKNK